MTLSDSGVVFAICTALFTGGAAGGKYWADHEYVPVSGLSKEFTQRDIRDLKKDIRLFEYDKKNGGLTDRQEWELEQLYNDLEDLQ